jgi:hypothetical protein
LPTSLTFPLLGKFAVLALSLALHPIRPARPIRIPLPNPVPWITVGTCPDYAFGVTLGCYYDPSPSRPAGAIFTDGAVWTTNHELGHAYDASFVDLEERQRFAAHLHHPDWPWRIPVEVVDGVLVQAPSLAELFADVYAACRLWHLKPGWAESLGAYSATYRSHRRTCRLVASFATSRSPNVGTPPNIP